MERFDWFIFHKNYGTKSTRFNIPKD